MADTFTERPPSLLDAALPRSVERAARKIADRVNAPVHVFHILSGQRTGDYDAVEATDTAWLTKYRNRATAVEVTVIAPSHDVPAPIHVMRDAQRRADRKGEALHLFKMKNGDFDGVFASDHTWLKQYRAKEEEVAVVAPTRAPNRPAIPSSASARQKKETPRKVRRERAPKVERTTPSEPSPEEVVSPTPVSVEIEVPPTVTVPKVRKTTPRVKQTTPVKPSAAKAPVVETPAAPPPAAITTSTAEEDELASAEARMDRLTRLLEEALAK